MRAWLNSHPRWRRFILYWTPALFLAWLLFGFFGVPLIVRKWVVPRLNEDLEGSLTVADCSFNPFTWRMVLQGADVFDKQGTRVLGAARIDANAEMWRTIFQTGWHLSELKVDQPYVLGEVMADGVPNLRKLRKAPPPRDPSLPPEEPLTKIPRLVVDVCTVEHGEFHLADATVSPPVKLDWVGLSFSVDQIDTDPLHNNPHTCTATNAASEKLTWTGSVYVNPLSSSGTLTLEKLDLVRFQPYIDRFADAKLAGGKVTVQMTYQFAPVQEPHKATASVSSLLVEGLKLDQGDLHILDLPAVRITNLNADAVARTLSIESIDVEGGAVAARRARDGAVSLATLIKPLPAATPAAAPTPVPPRQDPTTIPYPLVRLIVATSNLIDDAIAPWTVDLTALKTTGLTATWTDDALRAPARIDATAVALTAGPVRTADRYRVPLDVSATLPGGRGSAKGTIEPLGERDGAPFAARLDLDGATLALNTFAPYLPPQPLAAFPAADLRSGSLTAKGTLLARFGAPIDITWDGQAAIADLGFDAADRTRTLGAGALTTTGHSRLTLSGDDATLSHRGRASIDNLQGRPTLIGPSQIGCGSITVDGDSVLSAGKALSLTHTGPVALGRFSASGPIAEGGAPCDLALDALTLDGSLALTAGDRLSASHEGTLTTARFAVEGPIAGPLSATIAGTTLTGRLALRDGRLSADGRAALTSLALDARELAGPVTLTLEAAAIEGRTETDTTHTPTTATTATAAAGEAPPLALIPPTTGTLNLTLGKLSAEAARVAQTRLQWDAFRIDDLTLDTAARTMASKAVTLTNPSAQIAATIIPRPEGSPAPAGAPPTLTAADLRYIKPLIDRLAVYSFTADAARIDGGSLHATDPNATPPIDARIEAVEAQVTGFSTSMARPLALHFACKVAGSGKVAADGTIDLSTGESAKANGTVVLTAVPVVPFSAAPGHFLGYLATDGRISTTIPITLANDTMKGELKLLLDRFTLGEATNDPAAPSIPIKFGLAILEDRNGQIDLSLPFEGKITDPGFSVGGIIWKVIVNLITKAATAPFTLIGNLFGGGGDTDLSQVVFTPGASDLSPEAITTLDTLAKALTDRPNLNLAVRGVTVDEADTAGLKLNKLRASLAAGAHLQNASLLTEAELKQQTILAHRGLPQEQRAPAPPGAEEAPLDAMTQALLAQVQVTDEDLAKLREARAKAVIDFFTVEKQLPAARVKAAEPKPAPADKSAPTLDKPAALFQLF